MEARKVNLMSRAELEQEVLLLRDYKAWYDEAMTASNEAGFAGMDAASTIRALANVAGALQIPLVRLLKDE